MAIKDSLGRITMIPWDDRETHAGLSVCNRCGKEMSGCWDVVCAVCGRTFCYEHAKARSGFWFCLNCFEDYPGNLETAKANVAMQFEPVA